MGCSCYLKFKMIVLLKYIHQTMTVLLEYIAKFSCEDYVIVISQAGVGYHCYYTRPRVKPEVEC